MSSLPSPEKVKRLLASGGALAKRILSVARRLEALKEYGPEQALVVAADIVLNRARSVAL